MADYISREAVLTQGYWHGEHPDFDNPNPDGVDAVDVSDIEDMPAADVIEVVRCKDCSWNNAKKGKVSCHRYAALIESGPDDYCSYGKRRNE